MCNAFDRHVHKVAWSSAVMGELTWAVPTFYSHSAGQQEKSPLVQQCDITSGFPKDNDIMVL